MDEGDRAKIEARLQLVLGLMKQGWPRHVPATILTFAANIPYGDAPLAEAEASLIEGFDLGWDDPVWEPKSHDEDVESFTELAREEHPDWNEEMIRRRGREEADQSLAGRNAEVQYFRDICAALDIPEPKDLRDAYAFARRIGLLVEYDHEGIPWLMMRTDLNVIDAVPLTAGNARHEQYKQWSSKYHEDLRAVFRLFDPIGVRHTETTVSIHSIAQLTELPIDDARRALHGFLCHGVVTASRDIDEIASDELFQMQIDWAKVDKEYQEMH